MFSSNDKRGRLFHNKIFLFLVFIFSLVISYCCLSTAEVNAVDARVAGNNSREPNRAYHYETSGATWYYYVIKSEEEGFYIDVNEDPIKVPFDTGYGQETKITMKELKTCQEIGGMWVLATNEYDTTQSGGKKNTGKPATGLRLRDIKNSANTFDAKNDAGGLITTEGLYDYKARTSFPDNITLSGSDSPINTQDDFRRNSNEEGTIYSEAIAESWSTVKAAFDEVKGSKYAENQWGMQKRWDENSDLSFFCSGQTDSVERIIESFSTATIETNRLGEVTSTGVKSGESNFHGEQIVGTGNQTITFRHYITANDASIDLDGNSITATISTQGVPDRPDENRTITAISLVGSDLTMLVEETTVTVDLNTPGDKLTVCQTFSFSPNRYKKGDKTIINDSSSGSSRACVSLFANNSETLSNCDYGPKIGERDKSVFSSEDPSGDVKKGWGYSMGNTTGFIGVVNYNKLSIDTFEDTGDSSNLIKAKDTHGFVLSKVTKQNMGSDSDPYSGPRVYARPGDNIAFTYNLCFNAQSVYNDKNDKAKGRYIEAEGIGTMFQIKASQTNEKEEVEDDGSRRTTTTETKIGPFERNDGAIDQEIWIPSSRNVSGFNTLSSNATISGFLKNDMHINTDYMVTQKNERASLAFNSPDNGNINDISDLGTKKYSCREYDSLNPAVSGAYQIPGFSSDYSGGNCDSIDAINKTITTTITAPGGATTSTENETVKSLVGMSIKRTLTYTATEIWPNRCNGGVMSSFDAAYDCLYNYAHGRNGGIEGKYSNEKNYDNTKVSKSARVIIPYNFNTSLHTSITSGDGQIIYAGEGVASSHYVKIEPRNNELVSTTPYATLTPKTTKAVAVEYVLSSNTTMSTSDLEKNLGELYYEDTSGGTTPCNFFTTNLGAVNCKAAGKTESDGTVGSYLKEGSGNPTSATIGAEYVNTEINRTVPDYPAGFRYCVATAIYHGDSHGNDGADNLTKDPNDGVPSMSPVNYVSSFQEVSTFGANNTSVSKDGVTEASTSTRWHISASSCRTIAKKPTFQVWNGGVFSKGDIITSVSRKVVNANLGQDYKSALGGDHGRLFGSWAEYFVVSGGTIEGFASASGLGYSNNNFEVKGQWNSSIDKNYCLLSRLSIANIKCRQNIAGSVADDIIKSVTNEDNANFETFLKRFRDRYTNAVENPDDEKGYIDCKTTTWFNNSICKGRILVDSAYTSLHADSAIGNNKWECEGVDEDDDDEIVKKDNYESLCTHINAGTDYTGNARYIKIKPNPDNEPYTIKNPTSSSSSSNTETLTQISGTRIIEIEGDLTIDTNICYGNCSDYDSSKWNGLNEIPQVIILADNINIGPNVERIDAWLIAAKITKDAYGKEKIAPGYINTCSELGSTWNEFNKSKCNKTLRVSGPIFTGELYLRRTAGAWNGYNSDDNSSTVPEATPSTMPTGYDSIKNGSIAPGEIFDINPITYLWSYYQAQRFSHAIVVWQEEAAPRL